MIVVILKENREVIKFTMASEKKEKALVDKFSLGSVSQKARLKMPQLNREVQVSEILDMKFVDHWSAKRERELKDSIKNLGLDDLGVDNKYTNGGFYDMFGSMFGGKK